MKTKVVFRKFKKTGEVIALFPEQHANAYGDIMSYMHTGQHGAASPRITHVDTTLATPDEYANLLAELKSIGYDDLQIIARIPVTYRLRH